MSISVRLHLRIIIIVDDFKSRNGIDEAAASLFTVDDSCEYNYEITEAE